MKFTPLVASAHFLAFVYAIEKYPDATVAQCRAFANANCDAFLADATAPMGRHLTTRSTRRGRRDLLRAMRTVQRAARE